MLRHLFRPKSEVHLPPDERLYVFGDLHGRADLLERALLAMASDLKAAPIKQSKEIFLGDYIDRGPEAREVIEILSRRDSVCQERISLLGNHDNYLIDFIEGIDVLDHWQSFGGAETLLSYGVDPYPDPTAELVEKTRQALKEKMPPHHWQFLKNLRPHFAYQNYYFVHAGVRPGVPLAAQKLHDKLWIRDEFLLAKPTWEGVVVHGHTIVDKPVVTPKRIAIDTGAWFRGELTCLVLEGKSHRFLVV